MVHQLQVFKSIKTNNFFPVRRRALTAIYNTSIHINSRERPFSYANEVIVLKIVIEGTVRG